MNTVKIGDKFEDLCFKLIKTAVNRKEFGVDIDSVRFFQKKGYYSKDREKEIIFDLSLEIWSPNAKKYTLLFLIECKSSNSKKVPVDDVEEFYSKIVQVAGVNVKGVMISDNSFQKGGITFATNKGIMLINANQSDDYSIILHKTNKIKNNSKADIKQEKAVYSFIKKALNLNKIDGLEILSGSEIEERANSFRNSLNVDLTAIDAEELILIIKKIHKINFELDANLETINGKKILGFFDIKRKIIYIDSSIKNSLKFNFILGHELGHFFLHKI